MRRRNTKLATSTRKSPNNIRVEIYTQHTTFTHHTRLAGATHTTRASNKTSSLFFSLALLPRGRYYQC